MFANGRTKRPLQEIDVRRRLSLLARCTLNFDQALDLPVHVIATAEALAFVDTDGRVNRCAPTSLEDTHERLRTQIADAEPVDITQVAANVHLLVRTDD